MKTNLIKTIKELEEALNERAKQRPYKDSFKVTALDHPLIKIEQKSDTGHLTSLPSSTYTYNYTNLKLQPLELNTKKFIDNYTCIINRYKP